MVEIEQKFLVPDVDGFRDNMRSFGDPVEIVQGYLSSGPNTVRVRITHTTPIGSKCQSTDPTAVITIKGPKIGLTCTEVEVPIKIEEATALMKQSILPPIRKQRQEWTDEHGLVWEIDTFLDQLEGLVMAELELDSESSRVECPPWATREVSADARYSNFNLAKDGLLTVDDA